MKTTCADLFKLYLSMKVKSVDHVDPNRFRLSDHTHVRTKKPTCALGASSLIPAAAASAAAAAASAARVHRFRDLSAGVFGEAADSALDGFLALLERSHRVTLQAAAAPLLALLDLAQIPERVFRILFTHRFASAGERVNVCRLEFLALALGFHSCCEPLGTYQLYWALRCDRGRRGWISNRGRR